MANRTYKKHLALWLSICMLFSSLIFSAEGARVVMAADGPEGEQVNFMPNGSFEEVDNQGMAKHWTPYIFTGQPNISVDETTAIDGSSSLKISADSEARSSVYTAAPLPAQRSQTFVLQQWVKTEDFTGDVYFRVALNNQNGQRVGGFIYSDIIQQVDEWTLLKREVTVPESVVTIRWESFYENGTGTVWFDDTKIIEVPEEEAPEEPTGNLLPNGGFEVLQNAGNWSGGEGPAHVTTWAPGGSPVFTVDKAVYHEGSQSVRIDGIPPTISRGAIVQQINTMKINQPYLVSGWVKSEELSNPAFIRLQYQRDGNTAINISLLNRPISGTTDWTYFSQVITLPENTTNPTAPTVKVEAFLENATGSVWFDDFAIREHTPIEHISIDPKMMELNSGETAQITAEFTPSDATNQVLVWSSSNEDVAVVNQNGQVTAVSTGYSVITAESGERGDMLHAVVTVNPAETLSAQPTEETVMENGELLGMLSAHDTGNAPIEFELVVEPEHGVVTVQPDGTYKYYPTRQYSGPDEFMFVARTDEGGPRANIVSIDVTSLNAPPILNLVWYSTDKGTTLTSEFENALTPLDESITWTKSQDSLHGEVTVQTDGTFEYTPEPDFVGYDSFWVNATTEAGATTEAEVNVHVVPDEADFVADLQETVGSQARPRLLATEDDFAYLRSLIGTDPYMTEWFEKIEEELIPFMQGEFNGFGSDELVRTALMFQLTQDKKYADRAIEHLEFMATDPSLSWPGTYNSMLSLTYISYPTGLAYDWLYHEMTPEQRELVQDMVSEHIFSHALSWYRGQHNIQQLNNINFVNNGSHGILALALFDEGGQIGDEALEVLQGSYHKLQIALRSLTDDGVWPEGLSYWNFGTYPLYLYIAGLQTSLGTDYGLSDLPGIQESSRVALHLQGPGGDFNFAAHDNDLRAAPQSLWMADFYNKPEYAWRVNQLYRDEGLFSHFYLLFYRPGMFDNPPSAELDKTFSGIEAMSMRSAWDDPLGTFAAIKGADIALYTHTDTDAGTFVFDGLGERWAIELGNENYNVPGYWNYFDQGQRWTYYRRSLQGHNSVVINPSSNPVFMQEIQAPALLIDTESKPLGAYGILDMTERYPNDAVDYKRGMMLTGEREQLIVQDEMRLKVASEIYWSMHTEASIDIIEDGRAAILSQNDKKLFVKMLEAPAGAVFSEMNAEALPGTPNPSGQTINFGVQKLVVHMTDIEEANLSIWMVPLHEEEPLPQQAPAFTPLNEWSIPDGELPEKPIRPTLDSITVDGEVIENFRPSKTYYEVVFPYGETTVPQVEVEGDSQYDISIDAATELPGRTFIYVTDPVNPSVENRYTVSFVRGPIVGNPPDVNQLPIVGVRASSSPEANVGHTPDKTLDGDLLTRWTSEGIHWIEYDLGEEREVGLVSIAFGMGDVRNAFFTINTSLDGENWDKVYPTNATHGMSSGYTLEPELFHFDSAQAKYVRINVYGNSTSLWNNVTEVGIFRTTPLSMQLDVPGLWRSGEQYALSASYTFADGREEAAENIVFESSDPAILAIEDGAVGVAKLAGNVQLTVTDQEYGFVEAVDIVIEGPVTTASILDLVGQLEEDGAFANNQVVRVLTVHLTSVQVFEKQENGEKVIQHMGGYHQLLDHWQESMTEQAYESLKAEADALIAAWE